jgi:hypothetical protein
MTAIEGRKSRQVPGHTGGINERNSKDPAADEDPGGREGEMTATPALGEHIQKRQLETSVSWTGRERLRCLWYRLRLTVQEMNYATRLLVELQSRLP